ncbi:phosphate ABC transporter permease protein PstC [Gottschalkia purinilytica]|uniref:Phosphate transport system permease protein n=1 Tax=Gottschalkia purinilytica TaxID=1503 RepID=A0A0L0W7J8_GOTPU|nr:phosphate ABC transporter permease subunit PstC [Gottschalkia purinilytica]KNF07523.1 phosphate ABC transporter permease protein PstC [Gottschalkia purinilytica]
MRKIQERIFIITIKTLTFISILLLGFIIFFIFKESFTFFKNHSIAKFLLGKSWAPTLQEPKFSILPMILSTLYVAFIATLIALPIGIGSALFLSTYLNKNKKRYIRLLVEVLAGIPSVVYGFIGLVVLVKLFETKLSLSSGESVLTGGILLSIMILPYIISICDESIERIYDKYLISSNALGVSKAYMIRKIVLKECRRSILAGVVLALGRAMGETMAVMMVIGNSPIMPRLLGKCQTIPSLIALEMGMTEVGSMHYHALFASGFVLMVLILIINIALHYIKKSIGY